LLIAVSALVMVLTGVIVASVSGSKQCIAGIFQEFQAEVHRQLPGMYDFFPEDSLHITLMAMS
jgi:hypothetical protein